MAPRGVSFRQLAASKKVSAWHFKSSDKCSICAEQAASLRLAASVEFGARDPGRPVGQGVASEGGADKGPAGRGPS